MKGQSQLAPDGTHLYSDELLPHIRSNPTLMSYSVVNKHTDKHKHKRVQTDARIQRGNRSWLKHTQGHPGKHTHKHTYTHAQIYVVTDTMYFLGPYSNHPNYPSLTPTLKTLLWSELLGVSSVLCGRLFLFLFYE